MTATTPHWGIRPTVFRLGLGGAAGFWVTNFAISLTPLAAEYRAALGISYLPMLGQALLGGLIIGFGVSYCLLRFHHRLPPYSPFLQAILVSVIALVVATVLVEMPPRLLRAAPTDVRYLLIGVAIDTLRFLALGVVIGYLYGRLDRREPATSSAKSDSEKPPG